MGTGERLHLLYHELREQPGSYTYSLSCSEFDEQLTLFSQLQAQEKGSLRPEITFDDGHLSNFEHALPLLAHHGLRAKFFLTAGWIGSRPGYMDWNQVRQLHHAGHRIGAHGMTHTLLTRCDGQQLERELVDSRRRIEDELGSPVTTMSLPGGRHNRRVIAACREAGYKEVFTSIPRAEKLPGGALIGRINVRAGMTVTWLEELLQPGSEILSRLHRQYQLKEIAKATLGDRVYGAMWSLLNHEETEPGKELDI